MSDAFVALLRIELRFPDAASLKDKRSRLRPVEAHLRRRLGAAVAEVSGQDRRQHATLAAALVAGSPGALDAAVERLEGWLDAHLPDGARVQRAVASWEDLGGIG